MNAVTLPPLQGEVSPTGYDGRYRLYSVDRLPFDALPPYEEGGPAKVVLDPWGTSCVFGGGDDNVTLKVYRADSPVGQPMVRHELDGTRYDTLHDAARAVYNAGLTAFYVKEKDAAGYGLPTDITATTTPATIGD